MWTTRLSIWLWTKCVDKCVVEYCTERKAPCFLNFISSNVSVVKASVLRMRVSSSSSSSCYLSSRSHFLLFSRLSRQFSVTQTPPLMASNSLLWFRKGLRIHDNPALEHARKDSKHLFPVFILDPHYLEPDHTAFSPWSTRSGLNRIQFMLECLADLDSSFRKLGSRLLVFRGEPMEVLVRLMKEVSCLAIVFWFFCVFFFGLIVWSECYFGTGLRFWLCREFYWWFLWLRI